MAVPPNACAYHIVHVDNLPGIVAAGVLFSDAAMIQRGGPHTAIGMSKLKQRRLTLPVKCYQGMFVGDCVPFYLCPRSVMLYLLHRGNDPEITYVGGQDPIVHLEAELGAVLAWAHATGRAWATSDSNAAGRYAQFGTGTGAFANLDWNAIAATNWRDAAVKERKQAELLVHGDFPWNLVTRIGVRSHLVAQQVRQAIIGAGHQPSIVIKTDWYY